MNPNAHNIHLEPIEIAIRKKIGYVVSPHDLKEIPNIIRNLNKTDNIFNEQIKESRSKIVYNIGESSKVGAKYIHKLCNSL